MSAHPRSIAVRLGQSSRLPDRLFRGGTGAMAGAVVAILALLIVMLVATSWPVWRTVGLSFVTGIVWSTGDAIYGAAPFIMGTLLTSAFALAIAAPISLLVAIFLAELCPRRLAIPLTFTIELIAAIPSVVIGLWGLFILTPILRDTVESWFVANLGWTPPFEGPASGSDLFAASLLLALMIAPTIVAISREVISSVPLSQREAFLGMGATRWETIRRIVLPAARSGIIGAIILGLGRAIGETMAVTMMIGNADRVPGGIFDQTQTIASKIATSFNEASPGLETQSLLALGLVLLVIALGIGIAARFLIGTSSRMASGG